MSNSKYSNDPYLEVIAIFDSVNLPAKQREAILAWHHKLVEQTRTNTIKAALAAKPKLSRDKVYNSALNQWEYNLKALIGGDV